MERIADYVIRKVNEAGAQHIFLLTGRGILYLTDAVAKNKNIQPISTFHEQGASYAAMAYASAKQNGVAACLVSTGCAATNAVTACLCAYQDNLPIVFISGNNQREENTRYTGVDIRTYGSQEADIISVVKSVTKYSVMIDNADDAAYEVEKAIAIAQTGRKGPVWIDIPLDVQNMRIEDAEVRHYEVENNKEYNIAEDISYVCDKLNASKRPIILVGGGSTCCAELIEQFALKNRIPVVCSPVASDICGTYYDYSIGTVGSLGGSRSGNIAIQNSDFVLVLGSKLCSQLTGVHENFAREADVVVVDIDEKEHKKAGVEIDRVIISGIKEFLLSMLEENLDERDSAWMEHCIHWKSVFSIENEDFVKELKANNLIDIYSLMDEFSNIIPDEATFITDAGLEELIVPSAVKYKHGQRCLFPAAQGAMGYAIPAIIGAHEAGRKNIICVVGDGSIMMNIQELAIISSLEIPAKIIVVNNNMYSVIRKRQKDLFRKRTIGNDPSDGVPAPNFSSIADCFGMSYRKIADRTSLLNNLDSLFKGGLELIEVMCVEEQKYFHESYTLNEQRKLVHRPIEDMSPFLSRDFMKKEMIIDMLEE